MSHPRPHRAIPRFLTLALCLALLGTAPLARVARADDDADAAAAKKAAAADERKRVGLRRQVAEKLLAANELLDEEKYDEALALVNEAADRRKLGPGDLAQIHRFRGYIYVNKGMNEKAVEELQKSLDAKGLDLAAEQTTTYSLAQLYTQLGKYDEALGLVDAYFASIETPKPDAYYLKAMILVQQEKFAEALAPARMAVDMSPQPRESWVQLLVAIYGNQKDYPNVARTLQRLIVMSPGKKTYWVQLAAVQHFLERDAQAAATLGLADEAKLLAEDKEYRQLARLQFLRDLPYQCATTVENGMTTGKVKEDADAYRLVSNCYLAAREYDRALAPLAKAGELSPDGDMYMLLGQMHLQRERYAEALDALERSLAKAKPEQRGPVQLLLGVSQLGAEKYDAAERSFRAALADAKVRGAAESYLKFLADQRLRHAQQTASN